MTQHTMISLLANSNCFKDRNNEIWPKEAVSQKIKKARLSCCELRRTSKIFTKENYITMPKGIIKIKDHYSIDDRRFPVDGEQIEKAIKFSKYANQKEVAQKIGVSSDAITAWKSLKAMPLKRHVLDFADATGVRAESLVLVNPTVEQQAKLKATKKVHQQKSESEPFETDLFEDADTREIIQMLHQIKAKEDQIIYALTGEVNQNDSAK